MEITSDSDKTLLNQRNTHYKRALIKRVKIFIFLIIALITCFFISESTKKTVKLYYKEDSNINYLVYLKPNDYYQTPYLTRGMQYIASLIDYVDVDFNYNFKMNDQIKYSYNYYIDANVKVFEKDNPSNVIYQKTSKLVDNKVYDNQESLYFTVDENLKINYGEYNDLIKAFKTSYNVVADSTLTLTLHVYVEGEHKDFSDPIRTNSTMNMVIPLTEQMININMDYKEINNSDAITQTSTKGTPSNIFLGISIFMSGVVLISLIDITRVVIKMFGSKSNYQKKIETILREYDRVIVEVGTSNCLNKNDNFIRVKTFEELLDVSDRLEKPILHYEIVKNKKNVFMVRDEKDTYYCFMNDGKSNGIL